MAAPFEKLPEELKDLILGQCKKSTLKSARLTCRSFVPTVNRHLFRTVKVDIISSSMVETFLNVAADPALACCVKHLDVVVGMDKRTEDLDKMVRDWFRLCLYLEPKLPGSDNWILPLLGRRPWSHIKNPIKLTVQAVFRAVEKMQNISSITSDGQVVDGTDVYDPSMNVFLLALSLRLRDKGCFRTGLLVQWTQVSQRHFVNIWERQQMRRKHRHDVDDHPIPIFGMIKHLYLYDIQPLTRPDHRGFAEDETDEEDLPEVQLEGANGDEGDKKRCPGWRVPDIDDDYDPDLYCNQVRLSSLCSREANILESLALDFGVESINKAERVDLLKPWNGFALSPKLSKVVLSRFVASSDTLLAFLRHISPTLRDLTLEVAFLLPHNASSREKAGFVKNWILEHHCPWILDHNPPPPDFFWERVLTQMRESLSPSPLSSLRMRYRIDAVGTLQPADGWECCRVLLEAGAWDIDFEIYSLEDDKDIYPHQFEDVRDYVLGRRESLPPLEVAAFKKKHTQEGCASCRGHTPAPSPHSTSSCEEEDES